MEEETVVEKGGGETCLGALFPCSALPSFFFVCVRSVEIKSGLPVRVVMRAVHFLMGEIVV